MVVKIEREYEGRRVIIAKLDRTALAVAIEGTGHDWAAYIQGVPGNNHENEWQDVMHNGNKLPKEIAVVIFSEFPNLSYRR